MTSQITPLVEPWDAYAPTPPDEDDGIPKLAAGIGPAIRCPERSEPRVTGLPYPLPSRGPLFSDEEGSIFQVFDLPSSGRETEELRLRARRDTLHLRLGEQVMRPKSTARPQDAGDEKATKRSTEMKDFVDSVVRIMLELRLAAEYIAGRAAVGVNAELAKELSPTPEEFGPSRLRVARLPWPIVRRCLTEVGAHEPRMDVIVEVAQGFEQELVHLCERPRRVLRRERQRTPLGRVEQLDSACLNWLVQQPGRTPVEKAGASQQILAVVRMEDYDTLENRVLKDFLVRSISAAEAYVRQNRGRYSQSRRYRMVLQFRNRCSQLLRDTPLTTVRGLHEIPQPNYVLLHNRLYHKLWSWYLKLVRRKQQEDDAWRWQRRLWADMSRLVIGIALQQPSEPEYSVSCPFGNKLWIREEQDASCWLHPIEWPGPVIIKDSTGREVVAQCVHPGDLDLDDACAGLPVAEWIGGLGADMAVVFTPLQHSSSARKVCLFVWAIHGAAEDLTDERVQRQPEHARRELLRLRSTGEADGVILAGIILRSKLSGETEDLRPSGRQHDVEVLGMSVQADPRQWDEGVLELLSYFLFGCALECYPGG